MDALTLKGFLLIAAPVATATDVSIYLCLRPVSKDEHALIGIGSLACGLIAAGVCYLVQWRKELRTVHLPSEQLLTSESVVMETVRSIAHYRTGRPHRLWDAVGGKLVLTTHRLVFIAHRGQPWCYRLILPLEEIARAEGSEASSGMPGKLIVTRVRGKQEIFTFGAVSELDSDYWASAILRARYRLAPDWREDIEPGRSGADKEEKGEEKGDADLLC